MDIAQKLSRLIQLPTVSALKNSTLNDSTLNDSALRDNGHEATAYAQAFAHFPALIAELFPRLYAACGSPQLPTKISAGGILLKLPGKNRALSPVVLMAHYDVVPAPVSTADPNPFSGEITAEWVYGRGALDDKGPLCVLLEAAEQLLAQGFMPERDVVFALGSDEEVYGTDAKTVAAAFQAAGEVPYMVVDEGGAVVTKPLAGLHLPSAMIGVGEKGIATFELRLEGEGGHASAPPHTSVIGRMAQAVSRIESTPFPARAGEALMQMLRAFAARATGKQQRLLQAIAAHPRLAAAAFSRFSPEAAALVRTTAAVTCFNAGTAHNVLAPVATAIINCRIAPGSSVKATQKYLTKIIGDKQITVKLLDGEEPTAVSSTTSTQWQLLAAAAKQVWPKSPATPYIMLANTDSRHWHRFTGAVYRFAPLEMSTAQRHSIHGNGEKVSIAALEEGVQFWRLFLQSLPAADAEDLPPMKQTTTDNNIYTIAPAQETK